MPHVSVSLASVMLKTGGVVEKLLSMVPSEMTTPAAGEYTTDEAVTPVTGLRVIVRFIC